MTYDTTDYQRRTVGHQFMAHFKKDLIQMPAGDYRPGSIVLMRDRQFPCHAGILAEKTVSGERVITMIHAYARDRKVVEEPYTKDWVEKTLAVFVYKGTND